MRRRGVVAALALVVVAVFLQSGSECRAEDGYRLWLRYQPIGDEAVRNAYTEAIQQILLTEDSPTIHAAMDEFIYGLRRMIGRTVPIVSDPSGERLLIVGTPAGNATIAHLPLETALEAAGEEGYVIRHIVEGKNSITVITANQDIGVLYGVYAFLRHMQTGGTIENVDVVSAPRIQRRILDHWDNLNRFVERGYAGFSLWEWFQLPDYRDPRYRDYARACASVGINGAVLTNVNADALVLTPRYLKKAAALADEFRTYGVRVYLTARFSAPIEIGGLETADPLDPDVAAWWKAKVDEIYRIIPDFGGFLVKANSEGQPGPQEYGRSHAEGANMLADALAPHDGIVMWRAFVYATDLQEDRVKQAYSEFKPLDGFFRPNVVLQVKNGPLDFQPREPFHPLFGAMPRTAMGMEVQLTQEYLGGSVHLVYLAPLWKEVLDADTFSNGPGSTVARVIDGSLHESSEAGAKDARVPTLLAGVANIGTDRNWCGHPFASANWYAFGRLAWDYSLSSETIADEWARMTFSDDPSVVETITNMMLGSRETYVRYSMPLGLHHMMAAGHHYGPGPWVSEGRADWTATYYHQANRKGLGADRTESGTNALEQYAPELAERWGNLESCPENLLLWFHHVPWDHPMKSGNTLWDELCLMYQRGVDEVRDMQDAWDSLAGKVDRERFEHVRYLLTRQEREAREWRDACTQYFEQFSKLPLPDEVEPPERPLEYYESIQLHYVPGDPAGK